MGVAISFSKQNQLLSFHWSTGLRRILITHTYTHSNLISNTRTHTLENTLTVYGYLRNYSHSLPQICMLTEAPPTATIQELPTATIQNFLQQQTKYYYVTIQAPPTQKIISHISECDNSGSLCKIYHINKQNDNHEPTEPMAHPNSSIIILGRHFSKNALGYMYMEI